MSTLSSIQYHVEGKRGFLLDEEGFTVCELVVPAAGTPGAADAGPIAEHVARCVNHHDELVRTVARLVEHLHVASGDNAYDDELAAAQGLLDRCRGSGQQPEDSSSERPPSPRG